MRVYIPFNSNDFNSVFTTLSISPSSFYPRRKYSFKRSTTTYLNDSEDFLVGYERPIFHNREFDKDYGLPVLIEIDITEDKWLTSANGLRYTIISNTVFLGKKFRLLFRKEKELNETFAKSLKSIETKYSSLARQKSEVINGDFFVNEPPLVQFPSINEDLNPLTFLRERKLNRILGTILGSAIAYASATSKEWQEVSILCRLLNNNIALFLNKVSGSNESEKKRILDIVDNMLRTIEAVERLEETILLSSTSSFTSELLGTLKQSQLFGVSAYDLIIEGLLETSKAELPLSLRLEKLKRAVNSKYNSKYPSKYVEKISIAFGGVRRKLEEDIYHSRKINKLQAASLVRPHFVNDKMELFIPEGLLENERKYLLQCLIFFIQTDSIYDLETFFTNRKAILIGLATHFKDTIENFDGSKDRDYLIELMKSFDSLRGGFDISRTSNEVLKSIAILFTLGRDLMSYIDNNEREGVHQSIIFFTVWGSIYGAASFPKTLTQSVTEDKSNSGILISAYLEIIGDYQGFGNSGQIEVERFENKTEQRVSGEIKKASLESSIETYEVSDSVEKNASLISVVGDQILERVELKGRIKLADLKVISKSFRTIGDVEIYINSHLQTKIRVTKKGTTRYAELIYNGQLKFD
jgi:hypothetical protein